MPAKSRPVLFALQLLCLTLLIALALYVSKGFFKHAGSAPYMSTDDALADISHSLGHLGRYGFPSGPLQAGNLSLRLDGFHNYGPWYFYVGAFLSWLLGPSLVVQRSIHLFGVLAISTIGIFHFRRVSLLIGIGFSAVLLYIFRYLHWPMVRPDIMISVLTTLGMAFTAKAFQSSYRWWFFSAFCIAAATTQHLIAWALSPCLVLIWGVYIVIQRSDHHADRNVIINSLAYAAAGAISAAIAYLWAIDFRLNDVYHHLSSYEASFHPEQFGGFFGILFKHFSSAWSGFPNTLSYSIILCYAGALLVCAISLLKRYPERKTVLSYVLPPTALGAAYLVSLGNYGNWHLGYTILTQCTFLLAAFSLFTAIAILIKHRIPTKYSGAVSSVSAAIVLLLLAWEFNYALHHQSGWEDAAKKWVNIEDYNEKVLMTLPPRAEAWGTFIFGARSGVDTDILQSADGIFFINKIKPEHRAEYAPGFIVLGYRESNDGAASLLTTEASSTLLSLIDKALPNVHYLPVRLVLAPPYGLTQVFARVTKDFQDALPNVAVNSGRDRQWNIRILAPIATQFIEHPPVTWQLPPRESSHTGANARQTLQTQLPKGNYLIACKVSRNPTLGGGAIIATSTETFAGINSELGYGFVPVLYFPYQKDVYVLLDHPGGNLYLTLADPDPSASMAIKAVYPIRQFESRPPLQLSLPAFDEWKPGAATCRIVSATGDALAVAGDNSPWGYQVMSPAFAVKKMSLVTLPITLDVRSGKVGIGVLDQNGQWLLPPQGNLSELRVTTGDNAGIQLVVANMNTEAPYSNTQFTLSLGPLECRPILKEHQTYADRLTLCHDSKRSEHPDICEQPR